MNITDSLKTAFEVSLSTEQGDIEIADDVLKATAFMVALSSAAIYFALSSLERSNVAASTALAPTIMQLASTVLLTLSLLVAARVHYYHIRFRALCRNMIVARRMLHSELLEKLAEVEKVVQAGETPLWALVTSGSISERVHSSALITFPETQTKQIAARQKLDVAQRWQMCLFFAGFLVLLAAGVQPTLARFAA